MIDNMAGDVMRGFEDPEWEPLGKTLGLDMVRVHSGDFDEKAISIHDLPHPFVMDYLISPGQIAAVKKIALFKLALGVEGVESAELLSFGEIYEAANVWIKESNLVKRARAIESDQGFEPEEEVDL